MRWERPVVPKFSGDIRKAIEENHAQSAETLRRLADIAANAAQNGYFRDLMPPQTSDLSITSRETSDQFRKGIKTKRPGLIVIRLTTPPKS